MTSKSHVRSCEDVDDQTLSYAEVKALCAGNPLIKEKIDLDVSVAKLKALKANHVNEQYRLEDNIIKFFPEAIRKMENRITGYEKDSEHYKSIVILADQKMPPMVIMGTEITDKEAAGKALIEVCKQLKSRETLDIGEYKGFDMSVSYDSFEKVFRLELKREMTYSATLGTDPQGNITRINNALDNVPKILENSQSQLETAKGELGKPFPHEDELTAKQSRLAELNIQLNIEGKQEIDITAGGIDKAADKTNAAADRLPAVSDKVADKPPTSISEQIKYYKAVSDKMAGSKEPKMQSKLDKSTEIQ